DLPAEAGSHGNSREMLAVIILAVALLFPAPSQQPQGEPIDRVLGAWQGTIAHAGERRDMILECGPSRGRVVMLASTPAIHAWRFPVAIVTMAGNRIT